MSEYHSEYQRRKVAQQQAERIAATNREKTRNRRHANFLLVGTALLALLLLAIVPMRFRAIADDNSELERKYLSTHVNAGVIGAPTLMDARLSTTTQDPVSELAESIMTTENADLVLAEDTIGVAVTTISPSEATQRHIASWADFAASDLASKKDSCTQQDTLTLYKPIATTSLYYVALLDEGYITGDAPLVDVQVLRDDSPAQASDGIIYDHDTGILYVPQDVVHDGTVRVEALQASESSQKEMEPSEEEIAVVETQEYDTIEEVSDDEEANAIPEESDDTALGNFVGADLDLANIKPDTPVTSTNPSIQTVLDTGHYQLSTIDENGNGTGLELTNIFRRDLILIHPSHPGMSVCSVSDLSRLGYGTLTACSSDAGTPAQYPSTKAPLRAALDSGFKLIAVRDGRLYEVATVTDAYALGLAFIYYGRDYAPSFSSSYGSTEGQEGLYTQSDSLPPLSSVGFRFTWNLKFNPLFDNAVPVGTTAAALTEDAEYFQNYYSTNSQVASVDSNGIVTTYAIGETEIWAESHYGYANGVAAEMWGGVRTMLATVVVRHPASITIPKSNIQMTFGDTYKINAVSSIGAPIKYESSNTGIASVDASGNIKGNRQGNAVITVRTAQTNIYQAAQATVNVRVLRRAAVLTISGNQSRGIQVITGARQPVRIAAQKTSDAPIKYASSNASIAVVDASGNVTGKNPGVVTVTAMTDQNEHYMSSQQALTVTVKGDIAQSKVAPKDITYDGKAHNDVVTVSWGNKTLKLDTNYTLDITNAKGARVTAIKDAGKYNIKVNGIGNEYVGTTTTSVTVQQAKNPLAATSKKTKITVKYANIKKKAQTVTNLTFKSAQGKVTYVNASTDKTAKKFKVSNKGVVTVPKGTEKGTYTVKIKVTAAGNANYKAGSKTVTYKIVVK